MTTATPEPLDSVAKCSGVAWPSLPIDHSALHQFVELVLREVALEWQPLLSCEGSCIGGAVELREASDELLVALARTASALHLPVGDHIPRVRGISPREIHTHAVVAAVHEGPVALDGRELAHPSVKSTVGCERLQEIRYPGRVGSGHLERGMLRESPCIRIAEFEALASAALLKSRREVFWYATNEPSRSSSYEEVFVVSRKSFDCSREEIKDGRIDRAAP